MGIFVGLNFREQLQRKYGEPLTSELEQLTAGITTALADLTTAKSQALATAAQAGFRLLTVNSTRTATDANTTEKDLWTYSLPANSLTANNQVIEIIAFGDLANNANGKRLQFYWNNTAVVNTASQAWQDRGWQFHCFVIRRSNQTQVGNGVFIPNIAGLSATIGDYFTGTAAFTSPIPLKITGINGTASASDITFEGAFVKKLFRV